MKYVIQFPAGMQSLAILAVQRVLRDASILHKDDSAIVFESKTRITHASKLPFANNVFIVLESAHRSTVPRSIRQLAGKASSIEHPKVTAQDQGFRVMVNIDGELVAIDKGIRDELEFEIGLQTNLKVQARGSCREYWVIGRKNLDTLMLCMRLPKAAQKQPDKGSLAPELAFLMVLASNPEKSDAFLDPFGGSGSIVAARLGLEYSAIIYSDTQRNKLSPALVRKTKSDRRVKLVQDDALQLPSIADGAVNVIVTDPPWGEFERLPMPYETFANAMARSFDRVLHADDGRFVVLVTRKQTSTLVQAMTGSGFRIHATHSILVNGHPASVVVGSR
jgi:16S rRNA G966 N2-methylase RsmD